MASRNVRSQKYKVSFQGFAKQAILFELRKIIRIGRNPISRKKFSKDELAELKDILKEFKE
jgi:hypothetical protein